MIVGSSLDITIDASQFVARVLINYTSLVGVLYGRWKFDYWLVIPQGSKQTITIFNADPVNRININSIYFSSARVLTTGILFSLFAILYF